MKKRPIVLCAWEDARGVTQEWTDTDVIGGGETCMVFSVGLLLKLTKRRVVILPHFGPSGDSGCGDMVIPRSQVRLLRRLKGSGKIIG